VGVGVAWVVVLLPAAEVGTDIVGVCTPAILLPPNNDDIEPSPDPAGIELMTTMLVPGISTVATAVAVELAGNNLICEVIPDVATETPLPNGMQIGWLSLFVLHIVPGRQQSAP
jgi:hypothetical protein